MSFRRDYPHSFRAALKAAAEILATSRDLRARGGIDAEAEQIVVAAYRAEGGKALSRMELFARADHRLPEAAAERVLKLAQARAEGALLQHLTGVQVFLEHEYQVGPEVLVPRPETEILVSRAIETLRAQKAPALGLEIGLGSGCISIELLAAFPGLTMIASELSPGARGLAESNARAILGEEALPGRLQVVRATGPREVWEPLDRARGGRLADFLISNPPYLMRSEDEVDAEVARLEPSEALFAPEEDPLFFYREIASGAGWRVAPGGWIFLEASDKRVKQVVELFSGPQWRSEVWRDLTGRVRGVVARAP